MSADDFQTKYSSVMEGMLKSAVAETTKLFETMVDELKAEISKVKKENEDLKRKCSQFEKATRQTTNDCHGSESNPRKSGGSEKRDTAIQCDLVPFRAMLVEQCEPLQQPNQEQPCGYDRMEYVWKEHNYENREGRSSQMAVILVKQKDSTQQTVVKQEDAEPVLSCGRVLDTKVVTSAYGNENERHSPNQESSSAEMAPPQRNEKAGVGLELPQLKKAVSLIGVHNLSCGQEHSLPVVKGNMEKETEVNPQLSENMTQGELVTSERSTLAVVQSRSEAELQENELPSDGKFSVNEQRDVGCSNQLADKPTPHDNSKANDEQINGKMSETEPDQPVRRKRGRPPKKTKQQPVKQILLPKCTSENKITGSQQLSLGTKDGPNQASSLSAVSSTVAKPNTPTTEQPQEALPQSRERRTSATLQDAMLLVEAMNQSTDENAPSSPQRIAAITPTLQTVQEVPVEPEKTPISFETEEAVSNVPPETTTATEAQAQKKTVALQLQPAVTPSCTDTSSMAKSTATTQTSVHSVQRDHLQIKSVAHSKQSDAVTRKIIIMSRSSASLMHCKFAGKFAAKQPSVLPKVIAAQNISDLPKLAPTSIPPVKAPLSSALQKNIFIIPDKPLPAPTTDLQSVSLSQPKITILIPRQLPSVALSKQSQVIDLTTKQASGKSSNPDVALPPLISSSPEVNKVTTVSTTELTNTFDNLESHKQTMNVSTYTAEQTPPVVVRLTRLPFPITTQETVSVLSLHSGITPETQSLPKEESPSVVPSSQPSETQVSSSDICVNAKEACAVGFDDSADSRYVAAELSASKSEKETDTAAQDSTSPNVPPTEQPSPAVIHLMSIKSGDTSDPHSQMTKTQFLAQLAVSPILQDQEEPSTDDPVTTDVSRPMTSTSDEKSLRENTLVAKLRRHLKTHLQDRSSKTNQELCIETEIHTASPKKPEIEADGADDDSQTVEPIPPKHKKRLTVVNTMSPNETTNETSPVSTRRSRICKDGLKSKTTGEPARVSPQRLRATGDSTPVSHRRSCSGRDCVSSKTKKSTSPSPRRSNLAREDAISIKRQIVFNSPRKWSLTKERASLKKIKTTTVHSRRTSSTGDSASPKSNTAASSLPTAVGTPTKGTKSGTNSHSARRLELAEIVRSSKTGESTPAQKRKLIPEGSSLNENSEVSSCKRLAKATMAKTEAQIQNKSSASPEGSKRLSCKSVWTPPILVACETPLAGAKTSPNSTPIKTEAKTLNPTLVYPPSVSLNPIPVWAPPVVSPLQPLSVIGWRLLKNQCGECGRVLSSSAALESHVSLHTGHRPFSCKLCGKRFPDSKGLKRHGRVHRNGRIHICKQCGKGFVYSFGLTKHLQMVHSRIKPFVCQICNKGFFSKRDVEAHIRIHTGEKPFHCNLCEKKFARRTELNMHLRWHNGEKRHWCPFCGKGFLDINNLKRHKYTHTGEKPHACPHCPKHFTQSGHLKKHVRNVHKIQ